MSGIHDSDSSRTMSSKLLNLHSEFAESSLSKEESGSSHDRDKGDERSPHGRLRNCCGRGSDRADSRRWLGRQRVGRQYLCDER